MNFVRKQQNSRKRYSSKFEYDKLYFEIYETCLLYTSDAADE